MPQSSKLPHMHVRLRLGSDVSFGPGKADLLESIDSAGSISAAARTMRMSYKRAWQLIDEMNRSFESPLVDTAKGGAHGGGAALTDNGRRVVTLYRSLQEKAGAAAQTDLNALSKLVAAS